MIQMLSHSFYAITDNSEGRDAFFPPFFFLFNYCFKLYKTIRRSFSDNSHLFLFYFLPIWVIYQRIAWLWFWELKLPSNYEVLLRKVFDDCTKVLLSLSLCVCLFSVWVLRKCVKIKSLKFLDMIFDWMWWGFCLLGFEKMRERK